MTGTPKVPVIFGPVESAMNPDFASAVSVPDAQIDPARAALIFARDAYPDLDPDPYLARSRNA